MTAEFLSRFEEVVSEGGWAHETSPSQLLDRWSRFVEECERGYGWNVYEYNNELTTRDLLERVISDPELKRHEELEWIQQQLNETDRRFRELLQDDAEIGSPDASWWRRGVLKRARAEYAQDLSEVEGVHVEVV